MKSVLIIGMTPNPMRKSFLMTYFRKLKDTFKIDSLLHLRHVLTVRDSR